MLSPPSPNPRQKIWQPLRPTIKLPVSNIFTQTLPPGSNVTLTCMARGKPPPSIVWTKQSSTPEHSLTQTDTIFQSENQLFFSSIRTEDEGVYSCIASNSFGTVSETSLLTVLAMGEWSILQAVSKKCSTNCMFVSHKMEVLNIKIFEFHTLICIKKIYF